MGVYVVCGNIEGVFLYVTNQLIEHDANGMIEVVRQTLLDLQEMLNNNGHILPKNAMFQFDNAGEGKNKLMFTYLSLLIEREDFTEIRVNFLIVGHTHCIIDQYFSTLSQRISRAAFIGTPQALKYLFMQVQDKNSTYKPPLLIKQIEISYDIWTSLRPYINDKIKYFHVLLILSKLIIFKKNLFTDST